MHKNITKPFSIILFAIRLHTIVYSQSIYYEKSSAQVSIYFISVAFPHFNCIVWKREINSFWIKKIFQTWLCNQNIFVCLLIKLFTKKLHWTGRLSGTSSSFIEKFKNSILQFTAATGYSETSGFLYQRERTMFQISKCGCYAGILVQLSTLHEAELQRDWMKDWRIE